MNESDACCSQTCASLTERSQFRDTDFQADFRSLGGARHRARLSCVDSGETRILSVHDHGGIQMRGAVNDDVLVVAFMWGQDTQLNGRWQDVPRLLLLGPGTELTATQPGEYRYLRVGLRGAALRKLAESPNSAQSVHRGSGGVSSSRAVPRRRSGGCSAACCGPCASRNRRRRAWRGQRPRSPLRPTTSCTISWRRWTRPMGAARANPSPPRRDVGWWRARSRFCTRPPTSRSRSPRFATP